MIDLKGSLFFLVLSGILFIPTGCSVYSLKGASISPDVKNISIQNFYNESSAGPPNLSQTFTEKLKQFYQSNTSLGLTKSNGDLELEGSITRYEVTPAAPVGDAQAAFNRLTINVRVTFFNNVNTKESFENRTFSFFKDFPQNQNLVNVENDLINTIFDQIILDIFNGTVSNW